MARTRILLMAIVSSVGRAPSPACAFQNLLPVTFPTARKNAFGAVDIEDRLLAAIDANGAGNRLDNSEEVASLVAELEGSRASVPRPAVAPELYGRWQLLRTTDAATASPIQRRAVDATKYDIYQDIVFSEDVPDRLVVRQIVKFGDASELRVDALASTPEYPLPELTERERTGMILGLNILGVSLVGEEAAEDPGRPDSRVRFVFDEGKFDFGGFEIPYPVPFRNPLFRNAVKGWIDITYLSERVRISRGNKGTTFILVKEEDGGGLQV